MKPVRLLPIVVLAGSALLGLKLVGIVGGTGYTLTGIESAFAAGGAAPAEAPHGETAEPAAEAAPAAPAEPIDPVEAATEALFGTEPLPDGTVPPTGDGLALPGTTAALIEQRLAERRAELDALAAQLEERIALVAAAELRIDERMAELQALEAQVAALVEEQRLSRDEQFMAVVAMYAGMRARDASAIFNNLDMTVLVEVARAMDPRVLGPIVAGMEPARAQDLTVRLATPQAPEFAAPAGVAEVSDELPQIVGN